MAPEHAPPGSVPLLAIAGTRPELLKLAPVVHRVRAAGAPISIRLCFSGQHVELVESVLSDLGLAPDVDLRAPLESRSLSAGLAWLLERLDHVIEDQRPRGVLVQGDTNTALAGALVAFHRGVPCFHVEAGLRTSTVASPFPEELNRRLVARIAALHFAPTDRARDNLVSESIDPATVLVTGNTIVDALHLFGGAGDASARAVLARCHPERRKVLVTLHRRENANHVAEITRAVRELVHTRPDVEVLWILHLNALRVPVTELMDGCERVHLLDPLSYGAFLALMRGASLVLTDSGGVQEEAPVFGVPVLVLREETERPEAVEAGVARVVGASAPRISEACAAVLDDPSVRDAMSRSVSPFGDGRASERIVQALQRYFEVTPP